MLQKILSRMRKAIEDYQMIADGDHIAVGVSGGKDSLVLLTGLKALQRFLPVSFRITAVTLSMGFEGFDRDGLVAFYEKLGVDWHIEDTQIGGVVFDIRKESNPCALCANLKRGTIHSVANRLGCNKVAFGHHMDDAIETLMMSLIYEGRIHCFSPVTHLDRSGVTLIRPLLYAAEKEIRSCARAEGLTPIATGCPVDGITKREWIKGHIRELRAVNPNIKAALFGAIQRGHINGWKPMGKSSQYKKGHPTPE
jgi:tRNA(Ile)-lysidine synthase TilS/MesJ